MKEVVTVGSSEVKRDVFVQANTYEIDDESKMVSDSFGVRMKKQYDSAIDKIMTENLKKKGALIEAEKMASHVSVYATSGSDDPNAKKSSGKEKSGSSNKSSKVQKTKSGMKDSTKSKASESSNSMS